MNHNGHCFNCGETIPPGDNCCPRCQARANQGPVWLLSGCANCNQRWQWPFRTSWPIALFVIFLIADFIALSGRLQLIAWAILFGWAISRLIYRLVLSSQLELAEQRVKRDEIENQFDTDDMPDNPGNRKIKKDVNDKVRSLDWKVERNVYLRHFVRFATGFAILLVIWSWGPGRVIPFTKNELSEVVSYNIKRSKVAEVLKNETSKGSYRLKINRLRHVLLNERYFSINQFKTLVGCPSFEVNVVLAELKKTNLEEGNLAKHLNQHLASYQTKQTKAPTLTKKTGMQKRKEIYWLVLMLLLPVYAFFLIILGLIGFATQVMQLAYSISDEALDQFKLIMEQRLERRGRVSPTEPAPKGSTTTPEPEIMGSGVWHSLIGSTLAELLVKLITKTRK